MVETALFPADGSLIMRRFFIADISPCNLSVGGFLFFLGFYIFKYT